MVYTAVTKAVTYERERVEALIDAIPIQAWCLHSDGTVHYLNQRWFDYAGISRDEVYRSPIGETVDATEVARRIVHPDDAAVLAKWRQEIFPARQSGEFEVRLRRYDGGRGSDRGERGLRGAVPCGSHSGRRSRLLDRRLRKCAAHIGAE
jgi:PAS domain-containing protein